MSVTLAEVGQALYGQQCQSDLARDLKVADRTMRRWASGHTPVAINIYVDLAQLLDSRKVAIERTVDRIQQEVMNF